MNRGILYEKQIHWDGAGGEVDIYDITAIEAEEEMMSALGIGDKVKQGVTDVRVEMESVGNLKRLTYKRGRTVIVIKPINSRV